MKFIIGKKIGMTQVWQGERVVAVTEIQAGPCSVVQVKTETADGYQAIQLGYEEKKEKKTTKPEKGHFKGLKNFRYLREFRALTGELKRGDVVKADTFVTGDIVKVSGTSIGKGYQGVVRRHGFKGSKATHGNKDQLRMTGSVGATGPAHIFKGARMPGQMGNAKTSVKNLEIVSVDIEKNTIMIKGAVPGKRNSLVLIQGDGDLKISAAPVEAVKNETAGPVEAKPAEKLAEAKAPASQPVEKAETPEQIKKEVVEAKKKVDAKKEQDKV